MNTAKFKEDHLKQPVHLTLRYEDPSAGDNADITATYRVSEETLRRAQSWQAQTANPTARDLSDWLQKNGGALHRADGPAVVVHHADGSTLEAYYIDGRRHRAEGPAVVNLKADGWTSEQYYARDVRHRADGPAVVVRQADGSIREEYYIGGLRHRAHGPAVVDRKGDGSIREEYYIATNSSVRMARLLSSTMPMARSAKHISPMTNL